MRVLVVEDSEDTAEYLRLSLAQWGHQPIVATTGGAALREIAAGDPDVVLLDIGLPDISGWQVAAELERRGVPRRPLLIVLSGYNPEPELEVPIGVHAHFMKPPDLLQLEQMLADFARELAPSGIA